MGGGNGQCLVKITMGGGNTRCWPGRARWGGVMVDARGGPDKRTIRAWRARGVHRTRRVIREGPPSPTSTTLSPFYGMAPATVSGYKTCLRADPLTDHRSPSAGTVTGTGTAIGLRPAVQPCRRAPLRSLSRPPRYPSAGCGVSCCKNKEIGLLLKTRKTTF